jgi:MoaA/NifB/PqqE/SkfB family radical SAM enzyme
MLKFKPTPENVTTYCSYPWTKIKINPLGDMAMCCFQYDNALGNLLKNSFEEIWNGQMAQQIRFEMSNKIIPNPCKCSVSCPFNAVVQKQYFELKYPSKPTELEIDLPSQHCNIGGEKPDEANPACIMCERHRVGWKDFWQQDHLEELCSKLLPIVDNLKYIHVQGIAEPFWKNYIFQVLDWLNVPKYKNQITVSSTTNGTLITERCRARFLEYPKSTMVWSIDAATPETFIAIRRIDAYKKIVENLTNYCKERNANHQHVKIHNNINTLNLHEVEQMVELAAATGIEEINFNPTYNTLNICVTNDNAHLFQEAEDKIRRRASQLGVNATFMRPLSLGLVQLRL